MSLSIIWAPVQRLSSWPVTSQIGARRNALVACTTLAQRRSEHNEVEQLLRSLAEQSAPISLGADGSPVSSSALT